MKFAAPIPGMSLTREPGNAPYEQPPLYPRPEEALGFYFERLDDEELIDDLMFTLEQGFPLSILVDSMTSTGVMEGYHTIDVKVLISPILHEYLLNLAQAAGVDVVEDAGPTKEERIKEKDKKRMAILIERALEDSSAPSEVSIDKAEDMLEDEEEPEEKPMAPLPLISRRK